MRGKATNPINSGREENPVLFSRKNIVIIIPRLSLN